MTALSCYKYRDAEIRRNLESRRSESRTHGFVAVINDLHTGRDTDRARSAVIDASAIA